MDATTPQESSKRLSIPKQFLFSIIVVLSLLLLAEGAIRVWAYYFRTTYERYNLMTGRFELVPNIKFTERDGEEFLINSKGFVGEEFNETPSPGTRRIISIGDSCTFTVGLWRRAYPNVLQGLLNESSPSRRFEVINAGIEGFNSTSALARLKEELLRYRPDLVTIYIGWNDLMKENPESAASTGRFKFVGELLESSYLAKAYTKLLFVYLRPHLFRPITDPAINQQELHFYDWYVPTRYQANLESMLLTLKENKIEAVLFTLPTVVSLEMTDEQLKRQNVFFPYYAGSFSIGKFLSLHKAYNDVIREVGRKHDVPVVELDVAFDTRDKTPLFWDTMHPSAKGNVLIAQTVLEKLRTSGLADSKP
jgi:lysophospholipase L1-like esterase